MHSVGHRDQNVRSGPKTSALDDSGLEQTQRGRIRASELGDHFVRRVAELTHRDLRADSVPIDNAPPTEAVARVREGHRFVSSALVQEVAGQPWRGTPVFLGTASEKPYAAYQSTRDNRPEAEAFYISGKTLLTLEELATLPQLCEGKGRWVDAGFVYKVTKTLIERAHLEHAKGVRFSDALQTAFAQELEHATVQHELLATLKRDDDPLADLTERAIECDFFAKFATALAECFHDRILTRREGPVEIADWGQTGTQALLLSASLRQFKPAESDRVFVRLFDAGVTPVEVGEDDPVAFTRSVYSMMNCIEGGKSLKAKPAEDGDGIGPGAAIALTALDAKDRAPADGQLLAVLDAGRRHQERLEKMPQTIVIVHDDDTPNLRAFEAMDLGVNVLLAPRSQFDSKVHDNRETVVVHLNSSPNKVDSVVAQSRQWCVDAANSNELACELLSRLPFRFDELELCKSGESRELRLLGRGLVVSKLKDQVSSHTHRLFDRARGTDLSRLEFNAWAHRALQEAGFKTAFVGLLYRPDGIYSVDWHHEVAPLEVIAKRYMVGTPLHRYHGITKTPTLSGPPLNEGEFLGQTSIRVDWCNPARATFKIPAAEWSAIEASFGELLEVRETTDDAVLVRVTEGQQSVFETKVKTELRHGEIPVDTLLHMLTSHCTKDEVFIGDWITKYARRDPTETARNAVDFLVKLLEGYGFEIRDMYTKFAIDGETLVSEVSPDGMRLTRGRDQNASDYSKGLLREFAHDRLTAIQLMTKRYDQVTEAVARNGANRR